MRIGSTVQVKREKKHVPTYIIQYIYICDNNQPKSKTETHVRI